MNKIAIIISGEYRTFDICRKTMTFLDNENVDVYFSTWDRTIQSNKYLNYHIDESVTINRIKTALGGKVAKGICLERYDMFSGRRYNTNMIHRWKRGLDMVRSSGIEYEYICIIRPDLYFGNGFGLENILQVKDGEMAFGWLSDDLSKLQDISFIGRANIIDKVIGSLSVDDWNASSNHDWHVYWNLFVRQFTNNISNLHHWHHGILCRPNADGMTWNSAEAAFIIWRDAVIMQQTLEYSRAFSVGAWGEQTVADVERKHAAGYYEQFKLT